MTWPFTLCLHLHLTLHLQWQLLLQLPLQSRIHLYFYLQLHLDYIHTLDDLIFTFRQAVLLVFMESREELKSKGLPSVFMPRADRTKTLNMPSVVWWYFFREIQEPQLQKQPVALAGHPLLPIGSPVRWFAWDVRDTVAATAWNSQELWDRFIPFSLNDNSN